MRYIEEFSARTDLESVAASISDLLRCHDNTDLNADFPRFIETYSQPNDVVIEHLQQILIRCQNGERQQFVAYADGRAVGMSVLCAATEAPGYINPAWPNTSSLVCHPYRRQGIGHLSLRTRLAVVDEVYDGHAWTRVRADNPASQRLVESHGFLPVQATDEHIFYTYDKQGRNAGANGGSRVSSPRSGL